MSLRNLKISQKLPGAIATVAVGAVIVTGVVAYAIGAYELEIEAKNKVSTLMASREQALEYYLDSIRTDLVTLSDNDMVVDGLTKFEEGWDDLGADVEKILHRLYIDDNPNPLGEKHKMDRATDGSSYTEAHAHYHPWFRNFLEARGYYDIFLVNHHGKLVYTVFKEEDYATNLLTGKWKDTGLGKVVRAVLDDFKPGKVVFDDFAPYAPSHGAPASFIAAPIFDEFGEKHGILVFQMPIDRINSVMQVSTGMGETGETYIVGPDLLMRSDSRFSKDSTILKTKVDTSTVKKALSGGTGVEIVDDYRGIPVVSAYAPLELHGTRWAVMAEIDEEEALTLVTAMGQYMAITVVIIAAVAALIGFFTVRGTVHEIIRSADVAARAAKGDLDTRVLGIKRTDELGVLQNSINRLLDRAEAFSREAGAALKYASKGDYFRVILPEGMVGSFARRAEIINEGLQSMDNKSTSFTENAGRMGANIKDVVGNVMSTATQIGQSSGEMAGVASDTSNQSSTVSTAAEEAAENVQSVAAATEEFSAAISEVAQQVQRSADLGKAAVDRAAHADETIQTLSNAASRIGEVVNLINDIAEQTNLLALNATIEAARAGDAGKGFAVVASEVKNLANQTARATDEIVEQIKSMQDVVNDAVHAIDEIGTSIKDIDEAGSAIAASVEEQRAVVTDISSSIQSAVGKVTVVAETISSVSEGANTTSASVEQVRHAADDLQKRAEGLNRDVDGFLAAVANG